MNVLRGKIEFLRKKMIKKIEEKNSMTDEEVVKISQDLDKLIVKYERLLGKINRG